MFERHGADRGPWSPSPTPSAAPAGAPADAASDEVVELIARLSHDGTLRQLIVENFQTLRTAPDALIGTNVLDLIPPAVAAQGRQALQEATTTGRPQRFTYTINDQGEARHFEVKLALSGPDEALAIVRNVTARGASERELMRLNRSFVALQAAASAVTASLEPDQVLDTFTWEMTGLLSAAGCAASEWTPERGTLQLLNAYPAASGAQSCTAGDTCVVVEYPLIERVLVERYARQLRADQLDEKLPESRLLRQAAGDTLLLLPLVYQNITFGLVEIFGRPGQRISEQEVSLAQLLVKETAGALANARLYLQLDRRLREITTLNRIVEASTSSLDLANTLAIVTAGTRELLGAEAVSLALLAEDGRRLVFAAATGGAADFIRERELDIDKGLVGWVVRHGKPLLVNDVAADPRHHAEFDLASGFETQSLLCMPLISHGRVVGAVSTLNKIGDPFDEADQRVLGMLLQPAVAAIENARLYQQAMEEIATRQMAEQALREERALLSERVEARTADLQRQYAWQNALAAIEPTISHPAELDTVLAQLVEVAKTALPASAGAAIVLWDEAQQAFVIAQYSLTQPMDTNPIATWRSGGASRAILDSLQMLVVEDLAATPRHTSSWLRAVGLRSYVGVPLIVQGVGIGIIYALSFEPRTYAREELDFLTALANRAAVAIGNVRLYESINEANRQLARLARMKDEFLASMSHELRTPLNAILGISEGLQDEVFGSLNERQLRSVQVMEESGRHLLSLINDILDVAKIESGQMSLEVEVVRTEAICATSVQFVKQAALKKRINVSFSVAEGVEFIQADDRRLKQILINLLSNAVKFTLEEGTVGLDVIGDADAGEVSFCVWDTGIGIAAEDLPRLFRPFVQLDSTLSRHYAGTGLGLSLVKRMVELHNGRIAVSSELNEGSRFTIWLPWQPVEAHGFSADPLASGADQAPAGQKGALPGEPRILIVDDDAVNRRMYVTILASRGYQAEQAAGAAEALQMCAADPPDLILMDVQMPGMDGLEAIRRLRAVPATARLPIIALTALAMSGDRERCLNAGANDYLSKPVPLRRLVATVRAHLQVETDGLTAHKP